LIRLLSSTAKPVASKSSIDTTPAVLLLILLYIPQLADKVRHRFT
jgi:hypothetical protein